MPVSLPSSLGFAFWEKQQKGPLAKVKAPATKLPDELKALTKSHLAVDWDAFAAAKGATPEQVQSRQSALDDALKGKIKSLLDQAQAVEASATKFENEAKKDKAFPKESLTALATLLKAAKDYRADVDAAVAEARKSLASQARDAASQKAKSPASAAPGADSKSAKLVRTRGLDVLRKVRKPVPGAKPMRFIVVQGKTNTATYMGPSVGPTQEKLLKSMLPGEAPYRTFKDPAGLLAWEKNSLTFVSDVLPSGALKKMQLWLKKILKLNIKLRVRKTSGEVEETEGEDLADDMLKVDPAEQQAAINEFKQRLAGLQPQIKLALSGPDGAEIGKLMASVTQHAQGGAFDEALADLEEIEAILEAGDAPEDKDEGGGNGAAVADALGAWKVERAAVLTSLKSVAAKVASAKHPKSAKAIIELQAVIKNLTEEPSTVQQVVELRNYLGSDDVVNDVCQLAHDIRTPLLRALGRLQAELRA